MEKITNCPVCNSKNISYKLTCIDYVASNESFDINECKNCSHQFTNPRPLEKNIGKYYDSEIYVSHSGNEKSKLGFTYKVYDIVRNFSIDIKLKRIKKYHQSGKLLDLGCGLGYFLNGVKKDNHFEPVGVDISEDALNFIKNNFELNVFNENFLYETEDKFDIITQWHVIEHVYDLQKRLEVLKKLLKIEGTMFIAVPNSKSWDSKYYKKFWDGYDVPRHIHHFSKESFINLFENNGFRIIDINAMLFDAPYVSMRSEQHQKNSFSFIKGAFFGLISTISAMFTGQHSSLMFVVKHK
ncbi:MAG: class I SAM-dependent methyltransferase [Bacteroidia bacterium]